MDETRQVSAPSAEQILAALDPEQRDVAQALTGPVCVLAGAGTGKTRAITHRIAYGVRTNTFDPASVLAVTFTSRAAGEMRTRLRQLGVDGVQARTFHAAALRQLSYFLPRAEQRALPRLIDHKAPLVAQAASRLGLEVDRAAIRDLAAEVEWAKVNLLTPDAYQRRAAGRDAVAGHDPITIARLYAIYEEVLGQLDAMDFEDVLLLTVGLIASHDDVAAQIRRQYRHFVIDEYQDVSPLQQRLLELWLGRRADLCVVGDPNQTIYSFAGADASFLTSFARRYPKAHVVHLVRDYRSTPQVVALANAIMRDAGRGMDRDLVAQRPSGPAPRFTRYDDDVDEAAGIARAIGRLVADGVPASEIAILVRTNGQSEPFEQALAEAGVAYQLRGSERFFARREVREAMVLLRAAAIAPSDKPLPEAVRDVLTGAGWSTTAPSGRGAQRDRWESLQAIAELADQLAAGGATMAAFVADLDERAQTQHAPGAGGVTIASLHAAKGLEWDAVFLAGLSDGLVPFALADEPRELAEERRLLYVGVTRAREVLQLSYASARSVGRRAVRKPSRFLAKYWPATAPNGGTDTGARGADSTHLTDEQRALLESLRQWRAEQARAGDRPAFAVLPDASLLEIARIRPDSFAQLAQIRGIGPAKLEAYGRQLLALVAT